MTGKIRVSIVATSLDGNKAENKTVLNMVTRIQNRNTGYSESLFTHNSRADNNTLGSIDGATALKLDESFEIKNDVQDNIFNDTENNSNEDSLENMKISNSLNEVPTGVSIESASYIENNNLEENNETSESLNKDKDEEYTPKLFSDENTYESEEIHNENREQSKFDTDELFDQDLSEEEDFEIPAFLRKQKF